MMMYIPQTGIFYCFLVASNALGYCEGKCETVTEITLRASLTSEVFLPCYFDTHLGNSTANKAETVRWSHISSLLKITQDGNVIFDNPREGRVTVFANLATGRNFSILINDLQASDLGTYCCELNRECWKVEITESTHKKKNEHELNPWIYFAAGAGLFILLFIAFHLFSRFRGHWTGNCTYVNGAQSEGSSRGITTVYM